MFVVQWVFLMKLNLESKTEAKKVIIFSLILYIFYEVKLAVSVLAVFPWYCIINQINVDQKNKDFSRDLHSQSKNCMKFIKV